MDCVFTMLVDDLLTGQKRGYPITDHTLAEDDPDRRFWIKLILLFWIGDYPAQAKVSNMKHSGKWACHWCMQHFSQIGLVGYNLALRHRRHLSASHTARYSMANTMAESAPAPAPRTHSATVQQGADAHNFQGIHCPQLSRYRVTKLSHVRRGSVPQPTSWQ
jgi:hypothetical protein